MNKNIFQSLTITCALFGIGAIAQADTFLPEKLRHEAVTELQNESTYVCRGPVSSGQNAFVVDVNKKTAWVVDESNSEDLLAMKLEVTSYSQKRDGHGPTLTAILHPSLYGDRVNPDVTYNMKITRSNSQYSMSISITELDIEVNFSCELNTK